MPDLKKVKGQPTEWNKIFVNQVSDKGTGIRIYKNSYNLKINEKLPR